MSGGATARTSAYWSAPDRGQIAPGSLPEATMVPRSSRTVKAPPSSLQPLEHFMPTWNPKASPAVIADGRSHALRWTSWALTVQRAPALAPAWATPSAAAGISTMLYPYSPSSIGAVTVISAPEIVSLEGCERRSADFVAGRVEEQDRITRKIVLFGTFRHGFEGQRSAGIGFLGRNRQAQGDREKNGFLTIHG